MTKIEVVCVIICWSACTVAVATVSYLTQPGAAVALLLGFVGGVAGIFGGLRLGAWLEDYL